MHSSRRSIPWRWAIVGFLVGIIGVAYGLSVIGAPIAGGVPLVAPDGMAVTVDGDSTANLQSFTPTSGTVDVEAPEGNISFFSSGDAAATVHVNDIEGTWTNVTAITADPNTITIDPADKDSAVLGQEIDTFDYRAGIAVDDGTVDFAYSGSGPVRVTVQGVTADTRLAAFDVSTGQVLDDATSGSGGAVTFDALDSGSHEVQVRTFTPRAPTFSNASPTGGTSTPPNQVSVDVSDGDFPRGDSVTVTIDVDGSQVHSETITSNQTVTASVPASAKTGGQHSWSVEASDSYGETATDSYSYSVPSELQFRTESPPYSLIKNTSKPLVVEATFFEDVDQAPTIINRTTTDGTIDLTGLPTSSDFSVSVQAPGYHNRTVRLGNIYVQSDVFLVSKDKTTVENRFLVSDRTGNFPNEETSILIQAPVNESLYGSGGFQWKTVAGDDLGADEAFTTDLIEEKRYRIVVTNDAGDERILGAYTAETDGVIDLTIGSVQLDPTSPGGTSYNFTWDNSTGTPEVGIGYNDSNGNTSELYLHVYERNNKSNELIQNQSFNGPYGTFTYQQAVPAGENDTTWVVKMVAVKDNGENVVMKKFVGPGSPVLQDMPAYLVTIIFVGTILTVGGLMSQINGGIGGLMIAGLGAIFYFLNLVPAYLGGGVVVLSMLVGALIFIRERGGGAV